MRIFLASTNISNGPDTIHLVEATLDDILADQQASGTHAHFRHPYEKEEDCWRMNEGDYIVTTKDNRCAVATEGGVITGDLSVVLRKQIPANAVETFLGLGEPADDTEDEADETVAEQAA